MERTNEEISTDIKTVLEDKVKPAVAQHGGTINFMSFEDGVVKLEMAGACSGCAMSKVTLQNSVEGMLKHYVPEVQTIIGEDDDQAAAGGYTPYYPNVLE
jgi:Fe-S cluster biogenesis protein NfuA